MPLGTTTTLNKEELDCCFLNVYHQRQVKLRLTMTSLGKKVLRMEKLALFRVNLVPTKH